MIFKKINLNTVSKASIILYFIYLFLIIGLLTNWYRYGVDLETAFYIYYFIIPSVLLIILFYILSKYSDKKIFRYLQILIMVISIIGINYIFFSGNLLKGIYLNDVINGAKKNLNTGAKLLNYSYLGKNVESEKSRKEYINLNLNNKDYKIYLPLKENNIRYSYYGDSYDLGDWFLLSTTSNPNQFKLQVFEHIKTSYFLIDLIVNQVTLINQEKHRWQFCENKNEQKYICPVYEKQ
ncbi:MAG: hypothetical protein EXS49_01185 [Candidatus Pacebacteria bacterium]|nr:hypothetical protein [Candidatus Paceibacterota bacterium]